MVIDVQAPRPASTKSYGPGSAVLAAGGNGLIRQHLMRPDGDRLLEFAVAGFAHHDVARRFAEIGRWLRRDGIDIALGPGGDDVGDIGGVALAAQQMIGARQRDKALGMLGRDEDAAWRCRCRPCRRSANA